MRVRKLASTYRKRLTLSTASLVIVISLVGMPAASAIAIGGPSDCDNNAIISCGAHSTAALQHAYNSSAYVQKVYAYFGISNADMANLGSTNVAGHVTKDGNVFVEGQSRAVATNAVTGGRQNMPGSTQVNFQGATFYRRPPGVSFQQASLPAFVSMKNGSFQFAVIASCGNAVRAKPAVTPKAAVAPAKAVNRSQPTPRPVATQVQKQSQQQQVNINNSNTQTVQPASSNQPAATTTTTSQPASLVNTGPAGTAGAFLAATGLGTLAYRRFVLRKLSS